MEVKEFNEVDKLSKNDFLTNSKKPIDRSDGNMILLNYIFSKNKKSYNLFN